MNTLVAVGGTGQMVLHYYLHLYFLGLVEPFRAIVLDTAPLVNSLQAFQSFIKDLQYGQDSHQAFGADLPEIHHLTFPTPDGNLVRKVLTGQDQASAEHPARAFFSRDALDTGTLKGLFARPALSSTLSMGPLRDPLLAPSPSGSQVVVVVGSIIGGTGGGLIAPVLDAIQRNANRLGRQASLRAVLFAEYFEPDPTVFEDGPERFQSNQTLILGALKNAEVQLRSYAIVGGPNFPLVPRDADAEQEGNSLSFPLPDHPFFLGMQALHFLFYENIRDNPERFEQREVDFQSIRQSQVRLNYSEIEHRLKAAHSLADAMVEKEVIMALMHEPFPRFVWGRSLTDHVGHFWKVTQDVNGTSRSGRFPLDIQNHLRTLWYSGDYPLRAVLARPDRIARPIPGVFRELRFPDPAQSPPRFSPLFRGEEESARRAAASLLFWTLRAAPNV